MTFPPTILLSSTTHLYSTPIAIPVSYSTPSNPINRFHHSTTNSQPSLTLQSIQLAIQQPITLPLYSISTNPLISSQPSFSTANQPTLFSYCRYSYLTPTHPTNSISIQTLIAPQFTFLKPTYPSILLFHSIYSPITRCFLIYQPSTPLQTILPFPFDPHPINTNRTPSPTLPTSPFFNGFLEGSTPLPFQTIHHHQPSLNPQPRIQHLLLSPSTNSLIAFPTAFSSIHAFYPSSITITTMLDTL